LIMRVIAHTCAIYVTYHTCFTKTYLWYHVCLGLPPNDFSSSQQIFMKVDMNIVPL
jgi:hypothetical protein